MIGIKSALFLTFFKYALQGMFGGLIDGVLGGGFLYKFSRDMRVKISEAFSDCKKEG